MGDSRLALSLSSADGATSRPSSFSSAFYNTQGRKIDTPGATAVSIEMFISNDFVADPNRVGGLWGTAVDGADAITRYPIIEFANGAFQFYDTDVFVNAGLPSGFAADSFVEIAFELDTVTDMFSFFLNGEFVGNGSGGGSQSLSNIIIQGYNTDAGIDRTIYFDNLTTTVNAVPVPAALPLLASALAVFGFFGRRRRAA